MKYSFSLPQLPDTVINVDISFWSGKRIVLVNGIPAEKSAKSKFNKPKYIISSPDGTENILEIRQSAFDGGLTVFLNDTKIPISRPLKWYEYLMGGLPILLIFAGGALGALFGGIGAYANFKIIRSKMNIVAKMFVTLGISVLSVILYFAFALLINYAIHGGN